MAIYLTFSMALGYSISKIDLSLFEIKFLFWLPCSKFFILQALIILSYFDLNVSVPFGMIICFDAIALVTIGTFIYMSLKSQRNCISYLRYQVSGNREAKQAIEK